MGIITSLIGLDDDPKKIRKVEFEKALNSISSLTSQEKTYIKGVFSDELKDGTISIEELKNQLIELKKNRTDSLSDQDVEFLKGKLSGTMIDKMEE